VLVPFVLILRPHASGAPLVLVPMLVAESLGASSALGRSAGIAGVFNTIGAFRRAGRRRAKIYDLTGKLRVSPSEAFVVMWRVRRDSGIRRRCPFESETGARAGRAATAAVVAA